MSMFIPHYFLSASKTSLRPYEFFFSISGFSWSGFYTRNFSINDAVAIKLEGDIIRKITGRNEDILGAL